MDKSWQSRSAKTAGGPVTPSRGKLLQRKCACGGQASQSEGECDDCKKKKTLQRQAAGPAAAATPPPIVHDVLNSSGQPLDSATRNFFEPRFGHDFSRVRVHTDDRAAESARAVNAAAYTVGSDVVFSSGQFEPHSASGKKLLAHELAHTVQQQGHEGSAPASITPEHDPSESEADRLAESVTSGQTGKPSIRQSAAHVMRKLRVDKPGQMIPNPGGQGLKITNATAIESYLLKLAPDSGASVNRSSGKVSLSTAYCPGFLGGMVAGAKTGFNLFKGIPLLNIGLGVPAALIGGLIGGIAGLFGSKKPSAAASSDTPTSSTCLCDMVDAGTMWTIMVEDQGQPVTGNEKSVRVPSPNSPKIWGATTAKGIQENEEPWLVLAHELCGHAWLEQKKIPEKKNEVEGLQPPPTADTPLRHERTVERENLIRKEHGMDPRGYRLRDPFCGESFWRERGMPNGPVHWQESGMQTLRPDGTVDETAKPKTYLDECAELRKELPENKDGQYTVDKAIPEK